MREGILYKKIPTLLGLLFILFSLAITSFLARNTTIFRGRASPSVTPQNVRITNISDTSFTVSYITEEATIGSLAYGIDNNMDSTSIDDRDQLDGIVKPYKAHHITIKDLNPNQKYFFSILSGQDIFLNNGNSFEATTAPPVATPPPSQKPVSGKILLPDEKIDEAIVYLTATNSQPLSTLVKADGSYLLPLNSILNENLSSYTSFNETDKLQLLIVSSNFQSSIQLLANQIDPVPLITLSKDYDFTISYEPSDSGSLSSESASLKFPALKASKKVTQQVNIQTPAKDEGFTDPQPLFKGNAVPGEKVKITIQSPEEIQGEVIVSSTGKWTFRPKQALSVGPHKITITTKDAQGLIRTITQSFIVFVAGSQVAEAATPSATPRITLSPTPVRTPTPKATPTLIPTIITTPILTLAPTIIEVPTATPIIIETPQPIITAIPQPSKTPVVKRPPPKDPGSKEFIVLGTVGISATIAGIFLYLLSRGSITF